jgi:hypothetical protein
MTDQRRSPPSILCSCGKRGYQERQQARMVIRETKRIGDDPRAASLHAYRCPLLTGLFHVGHTNPAVNWPNVNDPRIRFLPGEL